MPTDASPTSLIYFEKMKNSASRIRVLGYISIYIFDKHRGTRDTYIQCICNEVQREDMVDERLVRARRAVSLWSNLFRFAYFMGGFRWWSTLVMYYCIKKKYFFEKKWEGRLCVFYSMTECRLYHVHIDINHKYLLPLYLSPVLYHFIKSSIVFTIYHPRFTLITHQFYVNWSSF